MSNTHPLRSRTGLFFLLAVCAAILACQAPAPAPVADDPAPSAAPAEVSVEIFGEGAISTTAPEFAVTVSADGRTAFFNRASGDRQYLAILVAEKRDGTWGDSTTAPFSGTYRDLDPFLSADGQRLYYSSNRPIAGTAVKDFDIWFASREGDGWSEPVNLGEPVNTAGTEIYATFAHNGNVYFSSDRGGDDAIYRAVWQGGAYREPELLDLGVVGFGNPCIAHDESFLIVAGELPGGAGASDLFVTFKDEGAWAVLENLSELNTPYAEFAPALSPDGETLYFTSERPGLVVAGEVSGRPPGDIYRVDLAAVLAMVNHPQ